jgi:23S rRNA pseudouridine2605 synthase
MSPPPQRRSRQVSAPALAPSGQKRPLKTLERVLSKAGLASRTEARAAVAAGRVWVNGAVVRDPDAWVDLERDRVSLDGALVAREAATYWLLYKPKGYLTTRRDPDGRPTIYDLLAPELQRLIPVGRLDLDTSGLLLLTNDTAFAERMTNPDFKVPKTYLVKASEFLTDEQLEQLRQGVELTDGPTRPAEVVRVREAGGRTVLELTLTEGRNRQVRRMIEAVGAKVLKLVRTRIGPLTIGELPIGQVCALAPAEVKGLLRASSGRA